MMHNPNIVKIRTYTIKRDDVVILETTDEAEYMEAVNGYKELPSIGNARMESYPDWKKSKDRLTVTSTGNYASMGGFIIEYYK